MKLKSTFQTLIIFLFLTALLIKANHCEAQTSVVCTNPTSIIYGLTGNGAIYPINVSNGSTGTAVKNTSYSGSSPSSANGMGYNYVNKKFYYFKRNVSGSNQQFVSFEPETNTVTILASSTCSEDVHTGSVNYAGTGYYTVDIEGNLNYYDIASNSWKFITSRIVDQYGADVDAVIRSQNAGDMALDGWGRLWLVTSSESRYGLYVFNGPLPTNTVSSITVQRWIAPTAHTPNGQSFAGIAFSPSGQIYMATKTGNRLYRLNDNFSLSFIGTIGNDVGNDLTSCNFPYMVLPLSWKSFELSFGKKNAVKLNWEVVEENGHGFYIEYSHDEKKWENIGFVQSQSRQPEPGGSIYEYSYSHINNANGNQYYRIKQVSENGKETYSEVKTITLKNETAISIWPNPATDQLRIASPTSGVNTYTRARIFDLSGRMLSENQLKAGAVNAISISKLPAGTYIVRIENTDGTTYNQKISKQ